MIFVLFIDTVHGTHEEGFDSFDEAMEFWNDFADSETCVKGVMWDDETGDVIWEFEDEKD